MSAKVTNEFHNHLDVCPHCREHVFDLCPIGAMALRRSVDEPFLKRESFQDLFNKKMKTIVDQNKRNRKREE